MGDLVMSLAAMSVAMAGAQTRQAVSVAMLRTSLDTQAQQGRSLVETLLPAPSSADLARGVGRNLDLRG